MTQSLPSSISLQYSFPTSVFKDLVISNIINKSGSPRKFREGCSRNICFPRPQTQIGKPPTQTPGPHRSEPDHRPRGRRGAGTRGAAWVRTFAPARCGWLKDPDLKRQALQLLWLSSARGCRVPGLWCGPEPGRQVRSGAAGPDSGEGGVPGASPLGSSPARPRSPRAHPP